MGLPPAPPGMRGVVSGAGLLRGSLRSRLGPPAPGCPRSRRDGAPRRRMPQVSRSVRAGHWGRRGEQQPAGAPAAAGDHAMVSRAFLAVDRAVEYTLFLKKS